METPAQWEKEAKAALSTSFLKWSPDHFSAALYYEKAGKAYQLKQVYDHSLRCYREASKQYLQHSKTSGSAVAKYTTIAKMEESCCEVLLLMINSNLGLLSDISNLLFGAPSSASANAFGQKMKDSTSAMPVTVEDMVKAFFTHLSDVSRYYEMDQIIASEDARKALAFSIKMAGELSKLIEAGVRTKHTNLLPLQSFLEEETQKLYLNCCQKLVSFKGEKVAFHVKVLAEALSFSVKKQQSKQAFEVLKCSEEVYRAMNQTYRLHVVQLHKVLLALKMGDLIRAQNEFTSSLQDRDYLRSSECEAAENCIKAYETRDAELWRRILSSPVMGSVNNQVLQAAASMFKQSGQSLNEQEATKLINASSTGTTSSLLPQTAGKEGRGEQVQPETNLTDDDDENDLDFIR